MEKEVAFMNKRNFKKNMELIVVLIAVIVWKRGKCNYNPKLKTK
jgi:hypothetical protein